MDRHEKAYNKRAEKYNIAVKKYTKKIDKLIKEWRSHNIKRKKCCGYWECIEVRTTYFHASLYDAIIETGFDFVSAIPIYDEHIIRIKFSISPSKVIK